ncbi:MAG: HEC/Ndc80p family-domain-containing protein [Benjaminiella poitrasii]|nr:MAG: HEC/Ndc80p family-domain-containing protein [Benjaminiella poitrasii]
MPVSANRRVSVPPLYTESRKRGPSFTPESQYPSKKIDHSRNLNRLSFDDDALAPQRTVFNNEADMLSSQHSQSPSDFHTFHRRSSFIYLPVEQPQSVEDMQIDSPQPHPQMTILQSPLPPQPPQQPQTELQPQQYYNQDNMLIDEEFVDGIQFKALQYKELESALNEDEHTEGSNPLNPRASTILKASPSSEILVKFNVEGKAGPNKKFITDPRNIKDGDVQRRYLRDINEYLKRTKYEGPPPPRNIRSLGAKDFQAIFKHLIHRLLPTYEYKRKFDDEVLILLRKLNYPMVDTISPKTLLSVGALHSTPTFFGLLHYLVECCKANDLLEADKSPGLENGSEFERAGLSHIFHSFAVESYQHRMEGINDPSIARNNLKKSFENSIADNKKKAEDLSDKNEKLRQEISKIIPLEDTVKKLKAEHAEYSRDSAKYDASIALRDKKCTEYLKICDRAENEEAILQGRINGLEAEVAKHKDKLSKMNVTAEELKASLEERKKLQLEFETMSAKYEELQKSHNEKMEKSEKLSHQITVDIYDYNLKARNIPLINEDITIKYDPDSTALNETTQASIKEKLFLLENLENEARIEFQNIQDTTRPLRDKLDTLKSFIKEKEEEIKTLEKQAGVLAESYEVQHTQFLSENEQSNILIDKHDGDLEEKKSRARAFVLHARNRQYDEDKRLNEMAHAFELEKATLLKKVDEFLNLLDMFKHTSDESKQFSESVRNQYEEMVNALRRK